MPQVPAFLSDIRARVERGFTRATAAPGFPGSEPSSGQCAAVALVLHAMLGGEFVSAIVDGHSHWFNRVKLEGTELDCDLTGDQFGGPAVRFARPGDLYEGTRVRRTSDISEETLSRAILLAKNAGLDEVARELRRRAALQPMPTEGSRQSSSSTGRV